MQQISTTQNLTYHFSLINLIYYLENNERIEVVSAADGYDRLRLGRV